MNGSITTAYDRVFKNIDRRLRIVENRETPSSGGGGGTTVIHAHINDTSGGVIDYLRTQWGTDHTNPALDPHTQYLNQARGDARYSLLGHNHNAAYAALGTTITAGSGLTGGGDLSANRTLNVGAGTGISVAADTVAVDQTFLDSRYALVAHNHDATYSPLNHNHDPVYVNVTGDTMTGALVVTADTSQFISASSGADALRIRPVDNASPFTILMGVLDAGVTAWQWYVTKNGNTSQTGNASIGNRVGIGGAAGTFRDVLYATAGLPRWLIGADTAAETGSNAGSDLVIYRYNDAGSPIDTVIRIPRNTGQPNFNTRVLINAGLLAVGDTEFYGDMYARTNLYVTTAATVAGKSIAASPDAGNIITWRNNGFYAAVGAIQISADPDNILEVKPDGLFVRKGLIFGK
jgi:hypothetical protein